MYRYIIFLKKKSVDGKLLIDPNGMLKHLNIVLITE